ncbi:hypothetical protein [Myroides sp. WP-1]|uniref:hypothetical protein n=1 Tax=Myroides sp. WP-1 TaxID=2759944 RepID=UPI0015FDEC7B|nr:hypothetical protein [Myroides sp. WP-1]MBB1140967.1 hypothetical protein [Myroides sp. WP-1]
MKKSIFASVLMLAMAMTSCSSDDNSATPEPTTKNYIIHFNHQRDLNSVLSDNDFQLAVTVVTDNPQREQKEAQEWELLFSDDITATYHYIGDKNKHLIVFGAPNAKSVAVSYIVDGEVAENTNFKSNIIMVMNGKREERSKSFTKEDNIWNVLF